MVGCRNRHAVQLFVLAVQHFSPVLITLRRGPLFGGRRVAALSAGFCALVDIAIRHDIVAGGGSVEIRPAFAADSDRPRSYIDSDRRFDADIDHVTKRILDEVFNDNESGGNSSMTALVFCLVVIADLMSVNSNMNQLGTTAVIASLRPF